MLPIVHVNDLVARKAALVQQTHLYFYKKIDNT